MKQQEPLRLAYISGTRADLGLVTPLLQMLSTHPRFELQLSATGMHLMPEHGNTIQEMKQLFPNTEKIEARFLGEEKQRMTNFATTFLPALVKEFTRRKPDLYLAMADRIEMLYAATVCLYLGIPVAHIHGGDKTQTVDDAARHAITTMAHLHFPATAQGRKSILAMGEESWRVKTVGAIGLDSIVRTTLLSRNEVAEKLSLDPQEQIVLVTQHPVSEEVEQATAQMKATLQAVKRAKLQAVIIYPNADTGSSAMIKVIEKERKNPRFKIYRNLDHTTFLSLAKHADVWIGNSSAGVVDSTTLRTPVINLGTRQQGRPHGKNVLTVAHDQESIFIAMQKCLHDQNFLRTVQKARSPWGDGHASERILKVLEETEMNERLLRKL